MSMQNKPDTQRETINQLWYAVQGSNGDSIWDRVRSLDERVKKLERRMFVFVGGFTAGVTLLNMAIRFL